jgi:hypothetical protein
MAIELVPLCTMRLTAKPPVEVGAGPAGTRMVLDETSVQVPGDRLRGQLEGAANDCVLVGPEGTGTIDVRVTLRTDDSAAIFVQYQGRIDLSQGFQFPLTAYVAPRFETGDERYAWLNRIQAVGKGTVNDDLSVDYEWYEVRLLTAAIEPMFGYAPSTLRSRHAIEPCIRAGQAKQLTHCCTLLLHQDRQRLTR